MLFMLQAVLRRLGTLSNDTEMVDEDELLCHQQLQNLYNSTRAAKVYIIVFKVPLILTTTDLLSTKIPMMPYTLLQAIAIRNYSNRHGV